MGFLKDTSKEASPFSVRITVCALKDVAVSPQGCHPKVVVRQGAIKRATKRVKNTTSPTLNASLSLPLDKGVTILTVWDAHRRGNVYLGELRLRIVEVVPRGELSLPVSWYKLHACKKEHSYAPGFIQLGFTVETAGEVTVPVSGSLAERTQDTLRLFERWREQVEVTEVAGSVDSQGFYSDVEESSVEEVGEDITGRLSPVEPSLERLSLDSNTTRLDMDVSGFEDEPEYPLSPLPSVQSQPSLPLPPPQRQRRFGKALKPFALTPSRRVLGVLFLEILLAANLPPLKSLPTSLRFDMDPFVVVSFGKKTFRTSWRSHTLNPIFNERLAFEVLESERDFDVSFQVLDKDRFSFHDAVGASTVALSAMVGSGETSSSEGSALGVGSEATSNQDGVSDPHVQGVSGTSNSSSDTPPTLGTHTLVKRKLFRKRLVHTPVDSTHFQSHTVPLSLHHPKYALHEATLTFRSRFLPYPQLRREFWCRLLAPFDTNNDSRFDILECTLFLESIGSTLTDETIAAMFSEPTLSFETLIEKLEELLVNPSPGDAHVLTVPCPVCGKRAAKSLDLDVVTHMAICASKDWSIVNKMLFLRYSSATQATRKWYSKAIIKVTYGKYALGGRNLANILVQDRVTGVILEEKMSMYVRLGIRLLYNKFDKADTNRVRRLLKSLSVKQGIKYDSPGSARDIPSFVQFHKLDLGECLQPNLENYPTFNAFFYRALREGARPITAPEEPRIVVSPADCRACTFNTISSATEIWIKGRNFSLRKLMANHLPEVLKRLEGGAIGIFRLAPQDYHRFHSPVAGVIGQIIEITGDYYTVNPMAIRSELDVFGENVRCLVEIHTECFGTVLYVTVGAMMVGSSVFTVKTGDVVEKGSEIGYFKFGGSTILTVFEPGRLVFDLDLVSNSNATVETLIRVGQSIGHSPTVAESTISKRELKQMSPHERLALYRTITGGDYSRKGVMSWEATHEQAHQ